MGHDDPYALPDVVISGALALALVDILEWAEHRTRPAETQARAEIGEVLAALTRDVADAPPPLGRVRWVSGLSADAARDLARDVPQVWHVPPRDLAPHIAAMDAELTRLQREYARRLAERPKPTIQQMQREILAAQDRENDQ